MSILVAGSLHLDVVVRAPYLPARDETLMGSDVGYVFGGKGGNQAVAAAHMGAVVRMAGHVGRDDFAAPILAALDEAGVDRSAVVQIDGATGMSVAIVDAAGDYCAVVVSGANQSLDGGAVQLPPDLRLLMLQNEISAAANVEIAARLPEGVRLMLNAAPARDVPPELMARVDILVVNRVEAAMLAGREAAPEALATDLKGRGPGNVIITLGADGLCGLGPDGPFAMPGHVVDVISTHGAGDRFCGALAARLVAGAPLTEACDFAQAAAALHVSTPVAARGRLRATDVVRFQSETDTPIS
ncbi:ribokinase [Ponticoccus sp. SC2-23]|uniref:ribokinase n=1 Tax=Alexandriicola marinus TaxID=2081710 RepID=UPI000FD8CD43|nr:ribokinase [Alexandriicola marinus]MBM1220877.1 ribokinase [Ponticoccus sp. SC6-9]MBM1225447.1 ribokinase [Ponticoccus sp. SC6-15]MBM1227630.1 ribokinase [Ponticoccus sp. SC6-38]MBM1234732.1 ribokinase [Ponticoccus sp. SC6-45]MBM1238132.1 ribokinase [Ponticoccus sp. SC6-49]MBM1244235.1 ribokinase [Ponticoccus sp. SC2-64]MBM1248256.1 ribokinase [Ponticoccus sp. SC6-42]MBM1252532.1 ribokinase [Ponticoccus sp. SC6-33]MBM1256141.1 ribokinase [Ponticoccus sp. SC6-60]MBM1261426.1 ribokinase 